MEFSNDLPPVGEQIQTAPTRWEVPTTFVLVTAG